MIENFQNGHYTGVVLNILVLNILSRNEEINKSSKTTSGGGGEGRDKGGILFYFHGLLIQLMLLFYAFRIIYVAT